MARSNCFTPTGASWLNQVERFFAKITEERIRRGAFRSVKQLERAIVDYLDEHNQNPKPFRSRRQRRFDPEQGGTSL